MDRALMKGTKRRGSREPGNGRGRRLDGEAASTWLAVRHYFWMCFSYVGLLAAGASEVLTRVPEAPFWGSVVLASSATFAVGAWAIFARAGRQLGSSSG